MTLLRTIVPARSAGASRAPARPTGRCTSRAAGARVPDLVDHQVAQLRRGELRVALAIMTSGNPDHAYGKATLEGVARRLLRGLDAVTPPA